MVRYGWATRALWCIEVLMAQVQATSNEQCRICWRTTYESQHSRPRTEVEHLKRRKSNNLSYTDKNDKDSDSCNLITAAVPLNGRRTMWLLYRSQEHVVVISVTGACGCYIGHRSMWLLYRPQEHVVVISAAGACGCYIGRRRMWLLYWPQEHVVVISAARAARPYVVVLKSVMEY
jgi:hypothetical protein